ncbi:ABATE domain-containing protein, partial [Crossiella equi]
MTEAPPAAPGADQYPALAFANTTVALPGGVFLDLLGTPATAKRWLTSADLAPPELDLQEMCTARLRALREHTRALLAARVTGQAPLPPALAAVNDALSTAPTAALLHWDPA